MYCTKCGKEISEIDRFCGNCGNQNPLTGEIERKEITEDDKIKFQLKPTYNIGYKGITTLGTAILVALMFGSLLIGEFSSDKTTLTLIFPWMIGILVGFTIIKMIIDAFQYKALEYNFYATKVEYKNGFLDKMEKELKYKNIREVTMSQNVLERLFKIGTIKIYTNASYENNGIYIHCIENVYEQYQKVKKIIDQSNTN